MKFIQDKDLGTYVVLNEEGDPQTHLGMTNFPEITDGDEFVNEYGQEFSLEFVDYLQLGELAISVWHERDDNETTDTPDHYTIQLYEIDQVTALHHGVAGGGIASVIFNVIKEFYIV